MTKRVDAPTETFGSLWDWRRRVADLWAAVRRQSDSQAAWTLWCQARAELFAGHPQTPLEAGASLPTYFPYDPALRFTIDLVAPDGSEPMFLPAGKDGDVELTPFARTRGLEQRLGGELTLFWIGGYGGGVFLPFLDATSGEETYGGGRYLLDTIKSADHGVDAAGRTILDFNFAYNPSCFYSPRWTCPLAPRENRLPLPVRGGELAH